MALHEAASKILIVVLILIKLTSGEQNVNKPARSRRLTKRHLETDFPPRLTHQPHSVRVKPREPHTVECPVESQPESEVKWFKDGQVLVSEPAHVEQTGSELMFFQTNDDDTGDYHCEAENYLGRVASERFRLTVQSSSIQDEIILLEPQVYSAAEQQDWPAEFRCTIPIGLLTRTIKLWQSSRPEQFVKWHRNGRPLSVSWDSSPNRELPPAAKTDQWGRGFVARQQDRNPNEFVLGVMRPTRHLDNNSTFTCRLEWDQAPSDESHESRPAVLRFEQPVKLDIPLGKPIDIPGSPTTISDNSQNNNSNNLLTIQNQTTQLTGDEQTSKLPSGRVRTSLSETLSDLYQIAKPTLILFGVMSLVAVIVLFQFLFVRRRAQANRYMKHHHHQYSSSASSANSAICGGAGSGGSGTSSALGDCDPVLSSLLARTLSAPSANSLTGATKKYKYYRDHMRGKVAAAVANDHQLVDGAHHDFIDAAAYFAATHQQQQQQQQQQQDCQASLFAANNGNTHGSSAVPNLYNQSLAAREQARSLLQGGEHVRSMGNLTASGQLQRLEHPLNKQHDMIMAGTQQRLGQHHLELPMNFGNSYNSSGPLESGAASLLQQQQQQQQQQKLWPGQHHLLLAAAAAAQQQHQQQQGQPKHGANNEQYQLVSCSSISPSSTSSIVVGSNSSAGTAAAGQQQEETTTSHVKQIDQTNGNAPTRDSISNHYSIIENNDDDEHEDGEEDERYEELDDREFRRSSARSSATSSSIGYRKPNLGVDNMRDFNRKTTFGVEANNNNNTDRAQQKSSGQLRASIISNGSSSNSSSGSTGKRLARAFGSKRSKTNLRSLNQDQLSPYAVSSICHNQQQQPAQPPPVSSEAMRALKEQFDINQLVLIDNNQQQSVRLGSQQVDSMTHRLPFNLPPPPPPPTSTDCESMPALDSNRSMRSSKSKRARQRGTQDD